MVRYVVVDSLKSGDMFTSEFEDKKAAIAYAKKSFNQLSAFDKIRRRDFYVLESVNPYEGEWNHLDGTIVYDCLANWR